jgi:hypothetical protein
METHLWSHQLLDVQQCIKAVEFSNDRLLLFTNQLALFVFRRPDSLKLSNAL